MEKFKLSVKDIAYIGMFVAIITICSWISIPTTVPFTLQTFAIFAAVLILGGYRSTLAVLVYLLLGAVGVPVFAGITGGVGILLGSTGGYLFGFLLTTVIAGIILHFAPKHIIIEVISLLIGLALCYTFGTIWFMKVYGQGIELSTALGWCVTPFLLPDAIKLAVAVIISRRVRPFVNK